MDQDSNHLIGVEVICPGDGDVGEKVLMSLGGDRRRSSCACLTAEAVVVRPNGCDTDEERLAAVELEGVIQETKCSLSDKIIAVLPGVRLWRAVVSLESCVQVKVGIGIKQD